MIRKPPAGVDIEKWQFSRNTQCNFDTVLQVISLRSQPEDMTDPVQTTVDFNEFEKFGFLFENEEDQNMWTFDFTINHSQVFDDGITELGLLHDDCSSVPMIKVGTEWNKLPNFLDTTPELRNIYFEVIQS